MPGVAGFVEGIVTAPENSVAAVLSTPREELMHAGAPSLSKMGTPADDVLSTAWLMSGYTCGASPGPKKRSHST